MANLNLADLLSFAKAGYSPKDVKELLTMELPEPKNPEVIPEVTEQKDAENLPKESEQDLPSQIDNAGAEDIDYKAKYEELEEKMKKLQEQNTRQDISGQKSQDPMQGVDDFLKSLM